MGNQGNRDQKSNPGQTGPDTEKPAGTTGRQGNSGTENWQQGNTDTPPTTYSNPLSLIPYPES